MQNFLISFEVIFPIFLLMVLGFLMRRINILGDGTVKQLNNAVFRVFLPVMVFKNIYESQIEEVFDLRMILFAVGAIVLCMAVFYIVIPLTVKENSRRGVMIQAIFRSNFVIFGLPVTEALCGKGASGTASVLVAIIIPLFNLSAVITLEIFRSQKPNFKKILRGIVTNPLIIASLLGLGVSLCGVRFPMVLEKTVGSVASIATPLALIVLGASLRFSSVGRNMRCLLFGIVAKLVLMPAIFLPIAAFALGFRGEKLAILLTLFASPTAVSSFTMAQQMGGDDELAGQLVVFGTTACVLTMFLWIFLAVSLGLI